MIKKILLTGLLALAILSACALARADAETVLYPFYIDGAYVLVDASGNIQPGSGHDYIAAFNIDGQRRFAADKSFETESGVVRQTALLDASGAPLTDYIYDYIFYTEGTHCFVSSIDGLFGAIDVNGNTLVNPEYTQFSPTGSGTYIVTKDAQYDNIVDTYSLIDENGSVRELPLSLEYINSFHDGLAVVTVPNGMMGVIDAHGEWVIAPELTWIYNFDGGIAVAASGGYTGLIDSSGQWLLPANYDSIQVYSSDSSLIIASRGKDITFFDRKTLIPTAVRSGAAYFELLGNDTVVIHFADRSAVCRADGSEIASFNPDASIYALGNDRLAVDEASYPENVEIIDLSGKNIATGLQNVTGLMDAEDNIWGVSVGRIQMRKRGEALVPVYTSMRYGILDLDGNILLPYEYDSLTEIGPGLFSAKKGELYGLIDAEGNWLVLRSEYDRLQD